MRRYIGTGHAEGPPHSGLSGSGGGGGSGRGRYRAAAVDGVRLHAAHSDYLADEEYLFLFYVAAQILVMMEKKVLDFDVY